MKLFKQNPVFATLAVVFALLFIAGAAMIVVFAGQAGDAQKKAQRAETALRGALSLSPAPTAENIEAAEANIASLREALDRQIATTKGSKPEALQGTPSASGTEMLFQLKGYKGEFLREAERTVPLNVGEKELEIMRSNGVELPQVRVPANFAFGFSRYLDSGEPPADDQIPVVYQQKEILTYLLRKLLNTRPISIQQVQREPVGVLAAVSAETEPGRGGRGSQSAKGPKLMDDEFKVGAASARVEGAVETLPFKIVFTGYTENLRSFLKQVEAFDLPLVVRSVEVQPIANSLAIAQNETPAPDDEANNLFAIFGGGTSESVEEEAAPKAQPDRVQIVAENESRFSVVLEYIQVTVGEEDDQSDAEEEDFS